MSRRKKILFCSEASFLHTGYSTYSREVLNYLHSTGKYEIAELAAYGQRDDPRGKQLPWKYYGVQPNTEFEPKASDEERRSYESTPFNQFGGFIFEHVCLDFKPDIVHDIRDFWQLEFADRSPFRNLFHWVIMPTVDADPQARQWIDTYSSSDALFTYSTWAATVLDRQSGGKINYKGTAPPSANEAYQPLDKAECRAQLGINSNDKIFGTVMRNQRRKLYPDLFKSFEIFLKNVDNPNEYKLYCHTCYPDLGWDIPELLLEHGLSSHVLFTYICPTTEKIFASLYAGAITESPFTGDYNATMCSVKRGADYSQMATIMNCFDLYVQYANSEGFGMPVVEAAACGVPVCATDYSAMSSVVRELGGKPLTPIGFYKELETGCMRAVPDNNYFVSFLHHFFEEFSNEQREALGRYCRKGFEENFTLEKTCNNLMSCFDELPTRPIEETWASPPRIRKPDAKPKELPPNTTHKGLARWLVTNVLCEPERLNSHFESRLVRDLMFQSKTQTTGGLYHSESSAAFDGRIIRNPFNLDIAYNEMCRMCDLRNHWEQKRMESIQ